MLSERAAGFQEIGREVADIMFPVIPGCAAQRCRPGIHRASEIVEEWIPGSRRRRAPE
jgi:hypothetical protein